MFKQLDNSQDASESIIKTFSSTVSILETDIVGRKSFVQVQFLPTILTKSSCVNFACFLNWKFISRIRRGGHKKKYDSEDSHYIKKVSEVFRPMKNSLEYVI